ncbi:hypothetical protein B0H16DRAFT_1453615 [Mycena metata]|uniref:Uncharacterized protein n=1 Tax=Mycena metata TaxID=1033252 RepID=A0AAD7JNR7_9AGAR|nr:hypothetical protein B0H16DRAFT_1453615 [Mycena metata]
MPRRPAPPGEDIYGVDASSDRVFGLQDLTRMTILIASRPHPSHLLVSLMISPFLGSLRNVHTWVISALENAHRVNQRTILAGSSGILVVSWRTVIIRYGRRLGDVSGVIGANSLYQLKITVPTTWHTGMEQCKFSLYSATPLDASPNLAGRYLRLAREMLMPQIQTRSSSITLVLKGPKFLSQVAHRRDLPDGNRPSGTFSKLYSTTHALGYVGPAFFPSSPKAHDRENTKT